MKKQNRRSFFRKAFYGIASAILSPRIKLVKKSSWPKIGPVPIPKPSPDISDIAFNEVTYKISNLERCHQKIFDWRDFRDEVEIIKNN